MEAELQPELVRVRSRRGTADDWERENPVLASGEWGVETDTGFGKVGTGEHRWSELAYGAGGAPTYQTSTAINTPDTRIEYDAARYVSVAIHWVFRPGASGIHVPVIKGRVGTLVFFAVSNGSGQPQQIGSDPEIRNLYIVSGQNQPTLTVQHQRWLLATGAIIVPAEGQRQGTVLAVSG